MEENKIEISNSNNSNSNNNNEDLEKEIPPPPTQSSIKNYKKRVYSILHDDENKEQPKKRVILSYHDGDESNLVTVEDPDNNEKSFIINKKYIQEDGSILSKQQYKKKIEQFNKQKKIDNRQSRKQKKRAETHKKNDEEGNITKQILAETSFHYKDNLRHIEPYQYTFKVFAKERWFGQSILDMFSQEFSTNSRDVYLKKIKRGLIKVNDQLVSPSYKIKLNDTIIHTVHRHEPPVTGESIKIVSLDENVVVVDKPSSIPVHPCGRFRHNSLMYILASEHGINQLYGVHRLDRLTSGLLLLARTPDSANKKANQIQSGLVSKQYLAKVIGKFPGSDTINSSSSSFNEQIKLCKHLEDGTFIIDQPIVIQSMRLGINHVGVGGKPSITHIKLFSYDQSTNTSIVLCTPKTGRTHQIRVHLKWLGFPIANDPLYNNEFKESFKALTSDGKTSYIFDDDDGGGENNEKDEKINNNNNNSLSQKIINKVTKEEEDFIDDGVSPIHCNDCSIVWSDSTQFSFGIYLHALSYSSNDWSYKTDLPNWAKPSFEASNETSTETTNQNINTTTTTIISEIKEVEEKIN
ncbi:pseudouridine synthase family protein [Dictyostelium discoideum AX4]|uniref:RNA pseudouridine synthase 7 n=1 Tax=Dictyostelium discoideum TaxID=44689 RepID=Q54UF9_DICDI|nr:pseudouridine synthase family protein [Dictyostelium discoideum AX4]EAL66845.1 pseudouridine synthase family protein [Dictyostelium discoideum AX4]|eukprot:XP_640817.1 pseudouridine synthase family protein [Dictyostelium discoideum AX4]